jgi:hypothetical protein
MSTAAKSGTMWRWRSWSGRWNGTSRKLQKHRDLTSLRSKNAEISGFVKDTLATTFVKPPPLLASCNLRLPAAPNAVLLSQQAPSVVGSKPPSMRRARADL